MARGLAASTAFSSGRPLRDWQIRTTFAKKLMAVKTAYSPRGLQPSSNQNSSCQDWLSVPSFLDRVAQGHNEKQNIVSLRADPPFVSVSRLHSRRCASLNGRGAGLIPRRGALWEISRTKTRRVFSTSPVSRRSAQRIHVWTILADSRRKRHALERFSRQT